MHFLATQICMCTSSLYYFLDHINTCSIHLAFYVSYYTVCFYLGQCYAVDTVTAFLCSVSKSFLTIVLFSFTLCGKIWNFTSVPFFCCKKWTYYYWLIWGAAGAKRYLFLMTACIQGPRDRAHYAITVILILSAPLFLQLMWDDVIKSLDLCKYWAFQFRYQK